MANHCEKLVKKLIEKIFKISVANSSATVTEKMNTNNTNNSSQAKSSTYF